MVFFAVSQMYSIRTTLETRTSAMRRDVNREQARIIIVILNGSFAPESISLIKNPNRISTKQIALSSHAGKINIRILDKTCLLWKAISYPKLLRLFSFGHSGNQTCLIRAQNNLSTLLNLVLRASSSRGRRKCC